MTSTAVDPAILRVVGDVGRPERGYDALPDTRHIPGKDGLLAGLANLWGWMRHGHARLQSQAEKHGPLYRGQIGTDRFVFVSDPKLAGEVLRNGDNAWSTALGWLVQFGGITDGPMDSPVTLDFGPHRDVRKLLQPAFKADALESYINAAVPLFESATAEWLDQGTVAFKPRVRDLFARVSAKVFMGVDDPVEGARLDTAMSDYWAGRLALSKREWLSPTWRRARQAYRDLFEHFRGQVDERRASDSPDLFSRLCRTNEGVDWLDDDALVRMFLAVMSAAFDTTSAAVSCWTEPDRFDPERLGADRSEGKKSRGAYMRFGAGAHSCVGAQLSALEAKAFWHTLLRKARFQFARPYPARHEFKPLGSVSGDVELIVEAV